MIIFAAKYTFSFTNDRLFFFGVVLSGKIFSEFEFFSLRLKETVYLKVFTIVFIYSIFMAKLSNYVMFKLLYYETEFEQ